MKKEVRPYPAVFPVPVALLTVDDPDAGKPNIITIAWVGNVCSDPPMLSVSIRPTRYSHRLVEQAGEFCINIPTAEQLEKADYCGVVSGRDHDKFAETGFTAEKAPHVNAPMIKECPVNIECRVRQKVSLGVHDMFIAEIVAVHIDENYMDEKGRRPDYEKIRPVAYCPEKYMVLDSVVGSYGFTRKS